MVKAVIGEESQLKKAENRLAISEIPAEVSILSYKQILSHFDEFNLGIDCSV